MGHTAGLPDTNLDPRKVGYSPDNLMMQSAEVTRRNGNPNSATKLTAYQINQMYQNRAHLNRNSPVKTTFTGSAFGIPGIMLDTKKTLVQ